MSNQKHVEAPRLAIGNVVRITEDVDLMAAAHYGAQPVMVRAGELGVVRSVDSYGAMIWMSRVIPYPVDYDGPSHEVFAANPEWSSGLSWHQVEVVAEAPNAGH